MRRSILVPLLFALLPASSFAAETVRTFDQTFFPGDAHTLELDLAVGSLTLEGTDERDVRVEVILQCDRENREKCDRRARSLYLEPRVRRGTLHVELKGSTRRRLQGIYAHLRVWAPRQLAAELDLRSGDIAIRGMASNLEIDSAAGDVDVVHHRDAVARVKIAVGVGKADLWLGDGHLEGRGFPRSLSWSGSGVATLEIDLGAGDATVRLE